MQVADVPRGMQLLHDLETNNKVFLIDFSISEINSSLEISFV